MPPVAAVAAQLAAQSQPVLCLDTCDLLDVIQCLPDRQVALVEPAEALRKALTASLPDAWLVISYLVPIEWSQNLAPIVAQANRHLITLDKQIAEVHQAWKDSGSSLPFPAASYAGPHLVARLQDLAEALLKQAITLDQEDACVLRAFRRVIDKRRPAHKGAIKDSIHLEHYLELVRQLRAAGFVGRCVFVSGNAADFWEDRTTATLHPNLAADLGPPVNLEFFGRLGAALGSLGIH